MTDIGASTPFAESVIGLYKTEVIRNVGPWKGLDDVEYATFEWVDWWNHRRLLEPIGMVPPVEAEALYYSQNISAQEVSTQTTESPKNPGGSALNPYNDGSADR